MDGRTHIAGGACLGAATPLILAHTGFLATAVTPEHVIPFTIATMAGGVVGGLLPDIDSPTSLLGRKLKHISKLTSMTCGHRGATHCGIAAIIWAILCFFGGTALLHIASTSTSFIDLIIKALVEGVFVTISVYFFCESLKGKISKQLRGSLMKYSFLGTFALGMFLQTYMTMLILVYLLGTAVGVVSHLILDMLTVEGVPLLLCPYVKNSNIKVRIAGFHSETGGKIVRPICFILMVVFFFFIFKTIVF